MASGSVYELAILLTLKDLASGGFNRVEARLQSMGKEGRATLKTFQDLRADLKKDLAVAGLGVGVLSMMRKGIDVAGDYEAAMGNLRMSIEEVDETGKINTQKLAKDFGQMEQVAVRLGNRLPGTTQDFVEMFSTLKQGGLESRTIIDGAGESVAHLAVVTNQVPKDLAEPFAQYAQQFKLTGDEAVKLSDTLAKIYFGTGLRPAELIEGSKFFQLRAGLPLGFTGLQGADISGRLLATLRSYGLEGGIGGRELGGFMLSLNFNTKDKQKAIAELKNTKGIELKFFDDKGAFLGVENVFKQMEKFRSLSTQEQMKFGEKLFDREGMAIASVFMKSGIEGWGKINQKIDKVPPLQELINQKTETYNAKLEAVKGTLTNLEATAFSPMLDTLKPILDNSNQIVGKLQEWSKVNPGITQTVGSLTGMGAITLTVVGGIGAMTTGWRLWRIASSIGVNEAGQLTFLRTLRTETAATGAVMTSNAGRAGFYASTVGRIPTAVTTTIALVGVEFAIQKFIELIGAVHDFNVATEGERKAGAASVQSLSRLEADYAKRGQAVPADVYSGRAASILFSLNRKTEAGLLGESVSGAPQGELTQALEPGSHFLRNWNALFALSPGNPYTRGTISGVFDKEAFGQTVKERAPELANAQVMRAFIAELGKFKLPAEQQGLFGLAALQRQDIASALQQAFPQSYQQATQSVTKGLTDLQQTLTPLPVPLTRFGDAATRGVGALDRFSNRLDGFELPTITAPTATPGAAPASPYQIFPKTSFSPNVTSSVTPAQFTPAAAHAILNERASSGHVHHHSHNYGGLVVQVPAGSRAADDPEEFLRFIEHKLETQSERA